MMIQIFWYVLEITEHLDHVRSAPGLALKGVLLNRRWQTAETKRPGTSPGLQGVTCYR